MLLLLLLLEVPGNVIIPRYDRSKLHTRIAHIGFNAFHCTHQTVCADNLASEAGSDWEYYEINLIGSEQQIADINAQQCLQTVSEMADDNSRPVRTSAWQNALYMLQINGIAALLDTLCELDIVIVSIMVAKKGYCHHPTSGQFNTDRSPHGTA